MLAYDLAGYLKNLDYEKLPAETVEAAKRCILDTLAVTIRGSVYDSSESLFQYLRAEETAGKSTVVGRGRKAPATEAALFNGASAHAVEMDDFHRGSTVHAGVVVLPAALAVAEETGASGKDLIRAVISGYEVMIRVGKACAGSPYDRGFHPTAICGPFGAASAAGLLYGLSQEEIAHALGIAGSYTGGLLEYKSNGAWTKRLAAGLAARSGVFAAGLAGKGFTGPLTIFEGRFGFLKAYGNHYDIEPLKVPGPSPFAIEEVSFKPHSSCRFTHAPIDALSMVIREKGIAVEEIQEIMVETHDMAIKAVMEPADRKYRPQTAVDAQFSIPYCLALTTLYGGVTPEYFTPEHFNAPRICEVADLVKGVGAERFTALFPAKNGSRVTVVTGRGSYAAEVLDAKGDPENQLSQAESLRKFRLLATGVLPENNVSALADMVGDLEKVKSVKDLTALMY